MEKTDKISGKVVKKGRKYFQVKLDTTKNDYLHKVVINEVNKDWKVGEDFSVLAIPKWDSSYNSGKWYISQYTPVSQEEVDKEEIDRWMGYVEKAYNNGYIYKKGVDKLRELGAKKELAKIRVMENELAHQRVLDRFVDYCTLYGKFLPNEWKEIHESGREKDIERAEKAYNEYLEKENAEKVEKQRKEEERRAKGYRDGIILEDDFVARKHVREGSFYEKNGRIYKVLKLSGRRNTERDFGEDGMSFGILSDYYYKANVQDVTDSNTAEVQEFKQYLKDKEKLTELHQIYMKKENTLKKSIERNASLKDGTHWHDIHPEGTMDLITTQDIYGHGEFLFVANGRIYWVICNHADGDNWSFNTVDGWGYGYSLKATENNMKLVDNYLKAKEDYEALKSKMKKAG